MEEIYELVENKRIFVRKKIGNFLEKLLRYCGYIFDHDIFKKIIYSEDEYRTPIEEKIKNAYDAYIYILHNDKNRISKSLWKRFYYLFTEEELEPFMAIKLSTKYFHINHLSPLEQAIEYHLYVYEELKDLKEEDRLILSLMIMNYILVRNQIPLVHLCKSDFNQYEKAREEFFKGNKAVMLKFMIALIKKNPYMEKKYYKNIIPVSLTDIIEFVEKRKEEFQTKYQIKGLWIHGSIAKRIERMDSDLDFFIELSLDLLHEEKLALIEELKQVFYDRFKRMVDLHEIVEYLDDDIIKEARTTKRLI